jgi:hypothetical protein
MSFIHGCTFQGAHLAHEQGYITLYFHGIGRLPRCLGTYSGFGVLVSFVCFSLMSEGEGVYCTMRFYPIQALLWKVGRPGPSSCLRMIWAYYVV